jgi:hypothetical protein
MATFLLFAAGAALADAATGLGLDFSFGCFFGTAGTSDVGFLPEVLPAGESVVGASLIPRAFSA